MEKKRHIFTFFAVLLFAMFITFAVNADDLSHKPPVKLVGQLFGKYGTVSLYENDNGYRWSVITEKSSYIVYGPGQQRREVFVKLDKPAPVIVKTTRWGNVYTDPRLVAGWIK